MLRITASRVRAEAIWVEKAACESWRTYTGHAVARGGRLAAARAAAAAAAAAAIVALAAPPAPPTEGLAPIPPVRTAAAEPPGTALPCILRSD